MVVSFFEYCIIFKLQILYNYSLQQQPLLGDIHVYVWYPMDRYPLFSYDAKDMICMAFHYISFNELGNVTYETYSIVTT